MVWRSAAKNVMVNSDEKKWKCNFVPFTDALGLVAKMQL